MLIMLGPVGRERQEVKAKRLSISPFSELDRASRVGSGCPLGAKPCGKAQERRSATASDKPQNNEAEGHNELRATRYACVVAGGSKVENALMQRKARKYELMKDT